MMDLDSEKYDLVEPKAVDLIKTGNLNMQTEGLLQHEMKLGKKMKLSLGDLQINIDTSKYKPGEAKWEKALDLLETCYLKLEREEKYMVGNSSLFLQLKEFLNK